jgi:hypothetical protein
MSASKVTGILGSYRPNFTRFYSAPMKKHTVGSITHWAALVLLAD